MCRSSQPTATYESGDGQATRARLLPERRFPPYAYLPGRFPHPVRHPLGHSYKTEDLAKPGSPYEEFRWGADLFNHGYYWEAHEAWEGLWQKANQRTPERQFYKALILLSATGVKLRQGKVSPAIRHYGKAKDLLQQLQRDRPGAFDARLGLTVPQLLGCLSGMEMSEDLRSDEPRSVFPFTLVPVTERFARQSEL